MCGRTDCHEVSGNGGIKLRTDSQGVAWAASQRYLESHLLPRWQLLFAAECLSWYPEVAGIMLLLSARLVSQSRAGHLAYKEGEAVPEAAGLLGEEAYGT